MLPLKEIKWKLINEGSKKQLIKIKSEEEVSHQDHAFSYWDDAF